MKSGLRFSLEARNVDMEVLMAWKSYLILRRWSANISIDVWNAKRQTIKGKSFEQVVRFNYATDVDKGTCNC